MKAGLVALSRSDRQVVAERSEHHIQIAQPELVAKVVQETMDLTQPSKKKR